MGATREFNFIVGPETSELPTFGTPTVDDDTVSKGYADGHYTQGGASVADVTALKAVASADRANGDTILVRSSAKLYAFNSGSAASGDDVYVIAPSSGTGRWIQVTNLPSNTLTATDNFVLTVDGSGGIAWEASVAPGQSVLTVEDDDYTVLDGDGYTTFEFDTGNTGRTLNLPTLSANASRLIRVVKTDTGTGSVTIEGESTETVGGSANVVLYSKGDCISIQATASEWTIVEPGIQSLTKSLDNDFTGSCTMSRAGKVVTVTLHDMIYASGGSASPATTNNFLPAQFRPGDEIRDVKLSAAARVMILHIATDGQIIMNIRSATDLSSAAAAACDLSTIAMSVSYNV